MTGPEHYAEAERLLRGGKTVDLPAAQAHATLALVAATASIAAPVPPYANPAWDRVLSPTSLGDRL